MGIEVKLPDLGDGIESGDVLEILVKEGDEIVKDQSVVEIETDKATVEVPSPNAGKVTQIHVAAGETVSVGAPLVTLETSDVAAAETPSAPPAAAAEPPAPPAPPAPAAESPPAAATPPPVAPAAESPATPTPPTPAAAPSPPATTNRPRVATSTRPIAAGPAIRRFAREVGVDLALVTGSGAGGRITRDDVLDVVRHANKVASNVENSVDDMPGTGAKDDWGPISIEQAPRIRQTIATKMYESWSTVPRVTNFDDADVTELEKMRQTSKADYAASGIKLTSMPFIIKSVSMALKNHPLVNASYNAADNQIIYKRYVNVGIAVDTDRGLVVPALRNTDRLSIAETAKELASMAERVRSNSFSLEDLRGGTFTISNLGAIGGQYSTPIINVPEVAILLVGRSRKMPIVVDDEVQIRLMMPMSLSYDHRLIDGATAARFLNDVIGFLQARGGSYLPPRLGYRLRRANHLGKDITGD